MLGECLVLVACLLLYFCRLCGPMSINKKNISLSKFVVVFKLFRPIFIFVILHLFL